MTMHQYKSACLYIFVLVFHLPISSCTRSETKPVTAPQFCIEEELSSKIKIDTVSVQQIEKELILSGKITANEDKIVKVYPLVGGKVEDLKVELGDYVSKGQVLAEIRSSEIAELENQYVSAQSNLTIAEKNADVMEDMFASGLAAEKDLILAKKELNKAEAELKKIQETLYIYGVGKRSVYTIKAPIPGFIIEKNVTENMQFRSDNSESFFTISDLDEVWVMANVFESDISKIQAGMSVTVKTLAYPDIDFHGQIDKIFNIIDPVSRVMKVRIKIKNKEYLLKPEMFTKVIIRYKEPFQMKVVPSSAVIFDKNKNYVMVYNNNCDIETREIKVYNANSSITYVEEGLTQYEKVISKHQLLIYDALND